MEIWLYNSQSEKKNKNKNKKKIRKMASNNLANSYVPNYVPEILSWYERDGLMTWYDQGKYKEFLRDTDKHFRETKIINFDIFDIIRTECRGEVVPPELLQYYETGNEQTVSQYPSPKQNPTWSSAFRSDRKDIFSEEKTIENHFNKKINNKKSKTIFRQSSFKFNFNF